MRVASVVGVLLLQAASTETKPFTPAPLGILLAWYVCSRHKRDPIGGWLMFFYWQVYGGVLITLLFLALNIQSYVPENFDNSSHFELFIYSVVPGLVLTFIQCAVSTFMLTARTWAMLKLLRWVMIADIVFAILAIGIDAKYFPDNAPFGLLGAISTLIWLVYLFRSKRVRHVFYSHDWDTAVEAMYPSKSTTRLIT